MMILQLPRQLQPLGYQCLTKPFTKNRSATPNNTCLYIGFVHFRSATPMDKLLDSLHIPNCSKPFTLDPIKYVHWHLS